MNNASHVPLTVSLVLMPPLVSPAKVSGHWILQIDAYVLVPSTPMGLSANHVPPSVPPVIATLFALAAMEAALCPPEPVSVHPNNTQSPTVPSVPPANTAA